MAADTKWFYTRGGQQNGPVALAELQVLMSRGQVSATDLVWREGMAQWTAARNVAELAGSLSAKAAPSPAPASLLPSAPLPAAPIQVGYYAPGAGMPPRAVQNLAGHARPRGDAFNWPLDDVMITEFQETLKLRKKVTAAAQIYRLLLLLTAIGVAVMIPVGLFSISTTRQRGVVSLGMGIIVLFMVGFGVLYYLADRATRRSQRWAPLTMFIVFIASTLLQIFSAAVQASTQTSTAAAPLVVTAIIMALFAAAFCYASWIAFVTIPKYLRQPAWCQELIVKAGI